MKNILILSVFILLSVTVKSQNTYLIFEGQENSHNSSLKSENFDTYLTQAYEAYNRNDKEKVLYYLDQAYKTGYVSSKSQYLVGWVN